MRVLRFQDWNILPKIVTISLMSAVIIDTVILFYFLPLIENKALEWDKRGVQHVVDVAYSLVAEYDKQVQKEIMPLFEAQLRAAADLQSLRYSRNEYFWINDQTPKIIMHPIKPELEGKNVATLTDSNGKPIFKEFVRVAGEAGSGFVDYSWPKPGDSAPSQKVSYVKIYRPWGWIIGSGIYVDEVKSDMNRIRSHLMLGTGLFALLSLSIAYWIGRGITRPLHDVITGLGDIASNREEAPHQLEVKASDEIGLLTREFNGLMHSLGKITQFKKMLEEEDSLEEVYALLGQVFKDDLGLCRFTILQVDCGQVRMRPAYSEPPGEGATGCSPEALADCGLCKAKRTGHPVSSLQHPKACRHFASHASAGHHCIPLIVAGNPMGVVQFAFAPPADRAQSRQIEEALRAAGHYIRESLPALETKRLLDKLRRSTLTDAMTGLHNRRFLEECLDQLVATLVRTNKQMALAMCDLDFFKQVNDQHGHDVGDAVLKETALMIKGCVREADIVVRFGGEEFLVLLLDVEEGAALEVAEKIRARVEGASFRFRGGYLKKTLSIGVSEFPRDTVNIWQAIKYADVALYQAKESGRNRSVRFSDGMWDESQY